MWRPTPVAPVKIRWSSGREAKALPMSGPPLKAQSAVEISARCFEHRRHARRDLLWLHHPNAIALLAQAPAIGPIRGLNRKIPRRHYPDDPLGLELDPPPPPNSPNGNWRRRFSGRIHRFR
ncbi:hypothetical protein AB5I41_14165 [Sphingomonas sp. MMS24-JH45]